MFLGVDRFWGLGCSGDLKVRGFGVTKKGPNNDCCPVRRGILGLHLKLREGTHARRKRGISTTQRVPNPKSCWLVCPFFCRSI